MLRKHDYFKLGIFVIVGTCMLAAVIIILGAGRIFEKTFEVETYFDESINGLEVGSPVKLRGVKIGRVSTIDFVGNIYEHSSGHGKRYVYVACQIDPALFRKVDSEEFHQGIVKEVSRGLRVRPTSLGLTGQLFLNFVYSDSEADHELEVNWSPKTSYIPSVPSTMSRIETAITNISKTVSGIKQDDIQGIISDVKSIVSTVKKLMQTEGGKEAGKHIVGILKETRAIIARANVLLQAPEAAQIIPQTAETITGVNRIINASGDDIIAAIAEARSAIASFKKTANILADNLADPRMQRAMGDLAPTLENITKASHDMSAAIAKVHALANRMNSVVASEEGNIHSILEDARELMQNLNELSGDAKRYPSGVIFGNPPSQANPESKQ